MESLKASWMSRHFANSPPGRFNTTTIRYFPERFATYLKVSNLQVAKHPGR